MRNTEWLGTTSLGAGASPQRRWLPSGPRAPRQQRMSIIGGHTKGLGAELAARLLARVLAGAHDGVVVAGDGGEDLALLLRGHLELVEGAGEVRHDGVKVGLLEAEALVGGALGG